MKPSNHLGFPVPLLGMEPVRLPVLFDDGQLIALAKPQGVLVQADSWYPRLPVLIEAIRHQAAGGKPEFARIGIGAEGLWAVTDLDPELYGPVLFARDRARAEELRGILGSDGLGFVFTFLTRAALRETALRCELPLARHSRLPRMLVSHTTGKRAATEFAYVTAHGPLHEWQARLTFPRRHQVLLHAFESGLPVLGDPVYARERPLLLSQHKRDYQPKEDLEERPLFAGPAAWLSAISVGPDLTVTCPQPPRWNGLVKQLGRSFQS